MKEQKKDCVKPRKNLVIILVFAIWIFLMTSGCSGKNPTLPQKALFNPPMELMNDIEIPDRSKMKTVGDMVRVILADEQVIQEKNADLKALRNYTERVKQIEMTQ